MRAVSFVENIEFDFVGPVLRNGLTLGDVDNDGNVELIIGSEEGRLSIFKSTECWQTITGLGFIASVVIGDVLNCNQNCLVIISADGWCHIYRSRIIDSDQPTLETDTSSQTDPEENKIDKNGHLECIHRQRIPANTKVALLGDIDGDGSIELVLGLTDRVVRSYRWIDSPKLVTSVTTSNTTGQSSKNIKNLLGKLVGLNKWECANQIGSVTLHHSLDGSPCLLVAQPGGTFMRIKCQTEDAESEPITENFDVSENKSVHSESFAASFVDYQFLGLSRMRNQNISTEILGDFNTNASNSDTENKGKPYAVATLDGTIMLVLDETILWAIQVDHQTFALTKLDVTGDGSDDIVVCSWDGQTYLLDQDKNSVRFQLDEPVQAFCSGHYTVIPGEQAVPCLVYVTFWNKIYLFYDIHLPSMTVKRFNPDLTKYECIDLIKNKLKLKDEELTRRSKQRIVEYLLYGVKI